ncbi:hypothetical protein GCM10023208_21030 [Erythrobacter westpacificensis]|uniref:Uncharacterized protein n=1 Tax=Erythrobacter westpacificensis TaxID=1055231 RepID=A0ABP9KGJ2_9SPHN
MARFHIFLVGSSHGVDVELAARDLSELREDLLHDRYLQGHMEQPDEKGVCAGVLIPASRLQMVLEL